MSNNIDENLTELDYKSLYHFAEWHDKQAVIIRARAQKLQIREEDDRQSTLKAKLLANIHKTVFRYLKSGCSLSEAQHKTAEHAQIPLRTVQIRWSDHIKDQTHKNRQYTRAKIYELHGLGYTNVRISMMYDIHVGSVSRILREQKKKRLNYKPLPKNITLFNDHARKEQQKTTHNHLRQVSMASR